MEMPLQAFILPIQYLLAQFTLSKDSKMIMPVGGILSSGLAICLRDYYGWLRLGPGGLPYNIAGWLRPWYLKLRIAERDTMLTASYDYPEKDTTSESEKQRATTSYLSGSLSLRPGKRPQVAHWLIPHRQRVSQPVSPHIAKACKHAFKELAAKYVGSTHIRQSLLERRGLAIFLTDMNKLPALAAKNGGEITHFHSSDCSAHVTLSYYDSVEVIQKGWGERHGLSGTFLPRGYMFLYAPESQAQVEVVSTIMEAAVKYASEL